MAEDEPEVPDDKQENNITNKIKKELRQSVNLDEILNQAEDKLLIDPELQKHK